MISKATGNHPGRTSTHTYIFYIHIHWFHVCLCGIRPGGDEWAIAGGGLHPTRLPERYVLPLYIYAHTEWCVYTYDIWTYYSECVSQSGVWRACIPALSVSLHLSLDSIRCQIWSFHSIPCLSLSVSPIITGLKIVVPRSQPKRSTAWFIFSPFSPELWIALLATGNEHSIIYQLYISFILYRSH